MRSVEWACVRGRSMRQLRVFNGALHYEFAMQVRRPAVWIGLGLIAALLFYAFNSMTTPGGGVSPTHLDTLILWTNSCNFLLTAGAGLLLADRMPRDRKTQVKELLVASPASPLATLMGKYLGSVAATLVPMFVIFAIGVGILTARWGGSDFAIVPLALAAFAALVVPAALFVGAFSIACTSLLWTPLYQFLFVGYWLWTNLNPAEAIPTLSGTLVSPAGNYVVTGFFHFSAYIPIDKGFYPTSSVGMGIANIAALLVCGSLALCGAWTLQRWQTVRQ